MIRKSLDIKRNLATGVLFLLPLVITVVLFEKVLGTLSAVLKPLAALLPFESVLSLKAHVFLALLLIFAVCYLAGFLVHNAGAGYLTRWLEKVLLSKIPGYSFLKSSAESIIGAEENPSKLEVVLVRLDDCWQVGFRMGRLKDGRVSVYLPAAPKPWSGSVVIFTEDRIETTDMSYQDAMRFFKQLGATRDS